MEEQADDQYEESEKEEEPKEEPKEDVSSILEVEAESVILACHYQVW